LESLLKASRALFILQQEQVKHLIELLEKNHPDLLCGSEGYDEAMARCHGAMNDEEMALHGVIRAYTEHSLRTVNQAVSDWLKADANFKTGGVASSQQQDRACVFANFLGHLSWELFARFLNGFYENSLFFGSSVRLHKTPTPKMLSENPRPNFNWFRLRLSFAFIFGHRRLVAV
jgi:hypothetical protein